MDNPQHYQPLSHALHPPSTTRSIYSAPTTSSPYVQQQKIASDSARPQEEEEEEEEEEDEEDDDDEGLVEEQLNNNDADAPGSNPSSPKTSGNTDAQANQRSHDNESPREPERKRRPGRPRGSKNRRPRVGSLKHEGQFYYHGTSPAGAATTSSGPPQHPSMNAQNQQYYEFQWRVLNLCAEFYGAAEELVKGTTPLVVAQCYHMGPGIKVDPLNMLGEAKRICDTLLANPSQLVSNPPPPMYPVVPALYQPIPHIQPLPVASTSTVSAPAPTSALANPPSVITNAQSFVVSMGAQAAYPQYPVYPSAPGQYATTPYYQYAPYTAAGSYYPQPQQPQSAPPATQPQSSQPRVVSATTATTQPTATITTTPATGGTVVGNQGAWSDEETERLKKMAEELRSKATGEINWDAVIQEWGISRTRHQILIKATALGLKESSTRGVKRRREDGPGDAPAISSVPSTSTASNVMVMPPTSSPSHSASTPAASPALQNLQRPPSAKITAPVTAAPAPQLAWPMPVVAVNAPASAISTSPNTQEQQQQRTSYYRPRPNQTDASGQSNNTAPPQPTMHHFMYTPNGQGLRPKENGK